MTALTLLAFLLLLGTAILVHELGHFLAARVVRVRIDELGIGLPPRLKELGTWNGTQLTLNWIPLGGFVRPAGEFDASVPDGLAASPALHRALVFLAGSAANLVLALALVTLGMMLGWPDRVAVEQVMPGSPADAAGLLPGDLVLSADGLEINDTMDLHGIIHASLGKSLGLDLLRGERLLHIELTPRTSWPEGQGPAGFMTRFDLTRYPVPTAVQRAASQLLNLIGATAELSIQLLNGSAETGSVRLSGPLGLKQMSDQAVRTAVDLGEIYPMLYLGAWISVALALTNMLPLPALDGGRLLFVLLGLLRGRRFDLRLEKLIHAAGMVGLLALLLVLTARDILDPLF
jgi:regulator of sigma E protease